jgi:hypothetical protein
MTFLLDAHVPIWWLLADRRLSKTARQLVRAARSVATNANSATSLGSRPTHLGEDLIPTIHSALRSQVRVFRSPPAEYEFASSGERDFVDESAW